MTTPVTPVTPPDRAGDRRPFNPKFRQCGMTTTMHRQVVFQVACANLGVQPLLIAACSQTVRDAVVAEMERICPTSE